MKFLLLYSIYFVIAAYKVELKHILYNVHVYSHVALDLQST